jgi:hypothetical protein
MERDNFKKVKLTLQQAIKAWRKGRSKLYSFFNLGAR